MAKRVIVLMSPVTADSLPFGVIERSHVERDRRKPRFGGDRVRLMPRKPAPPVTNTFMNLVNLNAYKSGCKYKSCHTLRVDEQQ